MMKRRIIDWLFERFQRGMSTPRLAWLVVTLGILAASYITVDVFRGPPTGRMLSGLPVEMGAGR